MTLAESVVKSMDNTKKVVLEECMKKIMEVEVFALAMVELDGKRSTANQSPSVKTIEQ